MRSRTRSAALTAIALALATPATASAQKNDLWTVYNQTLSKARYIDLTHTITPDQPVWKGFGPAKFSPAVDPVTGRPYTYAKDGFEATAYTIATDQFGTQFDPPAHWAPEWAAIDEVPATYSVRPLVVINTVPAVKKNPKDFLTTAEVKTWERKHGRIPAGSVVMVRSDWSKRWTTDPEKAKALAADGNFPSVGLDALKFLHRKRHILFHGHEPLDTDSTPTLEGEHWLMHNGYAQAEGVNNLGGVPATGCLVSFGSPKFKGGLGGYARYIAICPPKTRKGVKVSRSDAPLPKFGSDLHWDTSLGYRVR
jgi:kynurenine formamidase